MSGGSRRVAAHPERLAGLLEPVVSAAGLELESVRVGRAGRRSLLRVVVDAEQGVTLDDITLVSRAVAAKVDASDLMGSGPYTLEVSYLGFVVERQQVTIEDGRRMTVNLRLRPQVALSEEVTFDRARVTSLDWPPTLSSTSPRPPRRSTSFSSTGRRARR